MAIGCKDAIKNEVSSNEIAEKIEFEQPKMTKNTVVFQWLIY